MDSRKDGSGWRGKMRRKLLEKKIQSKKKKSSGIQEEIGRKLYQQDSHQITHRCDKDRIFMSVRGGRTKNKDEAIADGVVA